MNDYVRNKQFNQPYVHYYKKSYDDIKVNPEEMKKDALQTYSKQSKKLKSRFKEQMSLGDASKADEAMKSIEAVLNELVKSNKFANEMGKVNIFKEEDYLVDEKSFWSYSQSEKKRDELFLEKNIDLLTDFVEKLDMSFDNFMKISDEKRAEVLASLNGGSLPNNEKLKELDAIIVGDKKADLAVKKLIANIDQLKKYVNTGTGNTTSAQMANYNPSVSDADAKEIVRTLAGSLNGLKGGFFEVAFKSLINNASKEFLRGLDNRKGGGSSITITGADLAGEGTVQKDNTMRKTVSKSDINMSFTIDDDSAEMLMGLSLKTATVDKKTGLRKTTLVKDANLRGLIDRAGTLNSDTTYHIANSIAHGKTRGSAFIGAKAKLGADLALEALTGLGTKQDSAYFIVYTNKIVNIATLLDDIGKGTTPPFGSNMSGLGNAQAAFKKKRKEYDNTQKYIRSKECLDLILDTVKLTLTSSSKS